MPEANKKEKLSNENIYPVPVDMILLFLSFIENPYALGRLSLVSKLFNELIKDNRLWTKFLPSDVQKTLSDNKDQSSQKDKFVANQAYHLPFIFFAPMAEKIKHIEMNLGILKKLELKLAISEKEGSLYKFFKRAICLFK